ncbi:protein-export chaperone SecB [Sphingomonas bacterium]|uniref:protein-export chaperone SecB n=1 Tax=Sphingomonas bacterium TaxID=1895847 RepID=UPI001576D7D0|nr:protein-export chaperone SecB [Sphingomonas bacterium]
MADEALSPAIDFSGTGNGEDSAPAVGLISQYVKDLSFENPNAPGIYQNQQPPQIDVQFNIGTLQVADEVHEVSLKVEVRAEIAGTVAFIVDLTYAGLFGFRNVPAEQIQPYLLTEGPRLIFPFMRRVVADTIRDGGFPPLLLEPIDFNQLFMQQSQATQANVTDSGHA